MSQTKTKQRWSKILAALTLEEKCALLSGAETFKTRAMPRHGIPALWLSDGPHGVRKQAGESDHLGLNPSEPATCFPTAAAVANSWDPALGEAIGQALGEEAAAQGVGVLLGPGLNIQRNPLCGRNFEYFSEDPWLSGKMAAGYIRGIQSRGIGACPKHFAVNSQETRRMVSDSVLDERTLRELYLTGFEIAVREGRPKTIMTSYNRVNGVYANENPHLLQDILRGEWGFDGAVVTDWGGSNDHALGVKMGSTLEMPAPGGDAVRELLRAVRDGKIAVADLDARVEELLDLIFSTRQALDAAPASFDQEAHHALARRAAEESMVLLKNQGDLLPWTPETTVAVIGDFAETPRYQGAGSSMVNAIQVDTLLEALRDSGLQVMGYEPGFDRHGAPDAAKQARAAALAQKADAVLLCLGLDEVQESEGLDRASMKLARNQIDLLKAVHQVNPRIAVIFHAGSPVEMPWLDQCQALLYASLSGQAGAGALADALTGKVNPSGKLAETWPVRYEDIPASDHFAQEGRTVEYREGLYVGYRYFVTAQKPVLFPFGYGLSYTRFAYRELSVQKDRVSLTVTNTGKVPGTEIVQLYLAKPDSCVYRPARELKGFARVTLAPGASKRVDLPLDERAFRFWNTAAGRWEIEGGRYQVLVGASAEEIRLEGEITVEGNLSVVPEQDPRLACYRTAQVRQVPDEAFEALLGRPIPSARVAIDRNITFGELNHGRSPLGWLACAVLTSMLQKSIRRGHPDLNLLFIYNMPLRGLAKMTSGAVSMGMVDGLVMEARGFWIIGLLRTLAAFLWNLVQNRSLEKRLKNS